RTGDDVSNATAVENLGAARSGLFCAAAVKTTSSKTANRLNTNCPDRCCRVCDVIGLPPLRTNGENLTALDGYRVRVEVGGGWSSKSRLLLVLGIGSRVLRHQVCAKGSNLPPFRYLRCFCNCCREN